MTEQQEVFTDVNTTELIERAVASDDTMQVRIIAPGWGSSGYYSEEVLRRDGPTAWPAGTHQYLDHPTEAESRDRPERSVRDLAAVLISDPVYIENGKAGPGLYARSKVLPQFKDTIEALAPYIGVSIRARGTFKEGEADGRKGRIVDTITMGESVDFVTRPGAGGKVLALMESLREKSDQAIDEKSNGSSSSEASMDKEQELSEAKTRISELEAQAATDTTRIGELTESLAAEKTRADRAETALAAVAASNVAREAIKTITLPDASKDRIIEAIASNPPMSEGKLDEAKVAEIVAEQAKNEAEYLERALGSRKVSGMGQSAGSSDSALALKESFKKMYLSQGKSPDEAEKLAVLASGR